ncbi:MAG: hypothetical protein ACREH3_10740 [Geminicoccales bacterium]
MSQPIYDPEDPLSLEARSATCLAVVMDQKIDYGSRDGLIGSAGEATLGGQIR